MHENIETGLILLLHPLFKPARSGPAKLLKMRYKHATPKLVPESIIDYTWWKNCECLRSASTSIVYTFCIVEFIAFVRCNFSIM